MNDSAPEGRSASLASVTQSGLALWIFSGLAELSFADMAWQHFGYRRRPRRGRLFDWLIPRRKRRAEAVLVQELFLANLAMFLFVGKRAVPQEHVLPVFVEVVRILLDGLFEDPKPLWQAQRFTSREEALTFYCSGVQHYVSKNGDGQQIPGTFTARYAERLDMEFDPFVAAGAVHTFHVPRMLLHE